MNENGPVLLEQFSKQIFFDLAIFGITGKADFYSSTDILFGKYFPWRFMLMSISYRPVRAQSRLGGNRSPFASVIGRMSQQLTRVTL